MSRLPVGYPYLKSTRNLIFSKWEKIFKDPMTTAAAIDRLVHHGVILELNASSYRIEQAEEQYKLSMKETNLRLTKEFLSALKNS